MVKVREEAPLPDGKEINTEQWMIGLGISPSEKSTLTLKRAIDRALQESGDVLGYGGASCFQQGVTMAEVLAPLLQDADALAAAVLLPGLKQECFTLDSIREDLGNSVADLMAATSHMDAFDFIRSQRGIEHTKASQVDSLRKMLLVMVNDVRSVLIKLAERTYILRNVKKLSRVEQEQAAHETNVIWAPLANRLGIAQIKWELEDLAFRYLATEKYKEIASKLDGNRIARERYIRQVISELEEHLKNAGIEGAQVNGRVKHIYSIWRKMQRKKVEFEDLFDIRAVRILVPEVNDCYAALGLVHSLWSYIPKEFDDYIASPKKNGYRSLHTAVIATEGKNLEVQIRTHQMHQESELGVAAHWKYKEGKGERRGEFFENRVAWLRQLLEWQKEISDSDDLMLNEIRSEVLQDRVYVFTPKGEIKDLPMGSTPLDFAYYIHSDVGHRCRGAKVNGRMVPIDYKLKSGEQVEIITVKEPRPSRDWLVQHGRYLKTSRAVAHVQRWFKKQEQERNAIEGRIMLERELKPLRIVKPDLQALAEKFNYVTVEGLYAGIGIGDVRLNQLINHLLALQTPKESLVTLPTAPKKGSITPAKDALLFSGVDNLLTQIAGCCKPVPGEPISGYMSLGRGITIHHQECKNLAALAKSSPERIVTVNWGANADNNYPVDIFIKAFERPDLVQELNTLLLGEKLKIASLATEADRWDQTLEIQLTVEIEGLNNLEKILGKIRQISGVLYVVRQ